MEEKGFGAAGNVFSRRSLLAAGLKVGAGMAAGGVRIAATSASPIKAAPRATVRREPPWPPNFRSYVTRPDLTPPGVSVRTSEDFGASDLAPRYIFCAPKSPALANPEGSGAGTAPFPPGATPGLMILDTTGELVWFKPLPAANEVPFNFRVQEYNGQPVLTWFEGTVHGGHATGGQYTLADDTYQEFAQISATGYPCDLHEFLLTPEGTALHTAYETRHVSSSKTLIVGHAQEVDVATNELLYDWASYPAVSPDLSYTPTASDYFHINSIDLWPGPERNLLISARNMGAVYLVERETGGVLWQLGGKQGDFVMGPAAPFFFQHDARALADGSGVSLFDDASQPCPEKYASGKVINVDQRTLVATLRHRYFHTDAEFDTPSQGNCQLLDDGGHVVGWGYRPFFSVYGASGSALTAPLMLDGRFPDGASSYRTFLFPWSGRPPLSEFRLVVRRAAGSGNFTAWVSWNGATEVSAWLLRAGRSSAALETVATAKREGFETAIDFTHVGARVFEIHALRGSGEVLGRSRTVDAG